MKRLVDDLLDVSRITSGANRAEEVAGPRARDPHRIAELTATLF